MLLRPERSNLFFQVPADGIGKNFQQPRRAHNLWLLLAINHFGSMQ
jgi:hypothetical protein